MICLKFRLYPTKGQETKLLGILDLCREVYNSLLLERKATYETEGKSLTYRHQQNVSLKTWKSKFPELTGIHSQVLQNIAVRIDLAYQAFFRRVKSGEDPGYPRFKGKGQYDSITFPQFGNGIKLQGGFLSASKIGEIACAVHRPLIGTPKTCTIRRQANKWFACVACEYESEPLPESTEAIGIDMGLHPGGTRFAALSDGSFVENPHFFRKEEEALAKAQRKRERWKNKAPAIAIENATGLQRLPGLSRKVFLKNRRGKRKHCATWRSVKRAVSRIHERIRNKRHDFVHQLTRKLVNRFGLIAVEKLNVKRMSKRPAPNPDEETGGYLPNGGSQKAGLNKSILDAAWSQFRSVLSMKVESTARKMVEVNPAYTSQDCSHCGHRAKKRLKERWHHCPICGLSLDRDTNAAHNILQTAVGLHSVAAPVLARVPACIEALRFIAGE